MIDNFGNNVIFLNKLPVNAVTVANEDGSYSIFIKSQLSSEKQKKCYLHELWHIINDDFAKADLQEIEHDAHYGIEQWQKERSIQNCLTVLAQSDI